MKTVFSGVSISLHYLITRSPLWTMDKFVFRKKDAKAPPAPNTNASDADLPPLKYTSLALVRTWAQILFGVSQVTGAHFWFRSALGCILGVTVFCPYVKTVVEYCIDRILSVFREMGVNLLKGGGETYVDCGDKRPTESPTYNPYVYMFGEAVRLPIMALTCSAVELIEQCIISHCEKVFKCANQRPEGPGSYGDGRVLGIRNERPATFYLAPLQPFIATVPDYLREMRNTSMIQRATLQLRTHGSVDIRIFAASTSETTTVTSNVAIDLSDDVEIHETQVKSEQASSLKCDFSSDPDLVSVLQGMFLPEVLEEILSAEDPVFLNRVLKNMQTDGLGSYSVVDQARYVSLKSNFKVACPCLILSNPTNSHGEILAAFRSLHDLFMRIGGNSADIPKVVELHKAVLAGIPIRNNHLVVRMFHPSDIITPEQVITDCGNDPSKKTSLDELLGLALTELAVKRKKPLEANHEVHGHVKIICKAMYPD